MQHFTTSRAGLTITRLSPEETNRFRSEQWARMHFKTEAGIFCRSKGRNRFRIEGATEADGTLFDSGEDAPRLIPSPLPGGGPPSGDR
jgi:hypothetical protein